MKWLIECFRFLYMFIISTAICTCGLEAGQGLDIKNDEKSTHFYTRLSNTLHMTQ